LLDFLLEFIKRHRRPRKPIAAAPSSSPRKEMAAHLSSELAEIQRSITDGNAHAKAKEFYSLAKKAFKLSLGLEREVTFQEIAEEIDAKRHYPEDVRKHVGEFLEDIGMMEYGYEDFKDLIAAKRHDKERQLRVYIDDLEKEHTHITRETKKKISSIVSETLPSTDREFLVMMVERLRSFMHRLF
jgi:hypothetical protein